MAKIIVQNQLFSFNQIRKEGMNLCPDPAYLNSFVLAQRWLSGEHVFEFHTSGSTGVSKKISLQRSQLKSSALGTIHTLGLTADEHLLVCMNTSFIGGAMLLIRGLILGATITLQQPSGNPLAQIDAHHPYSFVSFAPMQVYGIIHNQYQERAKLSAFKHVLIGGGPIDLFLSEALASLPTSVYHTYGMTETVSHIALKKLGTDSFYKTLPGVSIQTDERNCLAIKSGATNHEWIQTNDIVKLIDSHSFDVLGRADTIINTGGMKVLPAKVESAIRSILQHQLSNVFVTSLPDARLGNKLIAIIESSESEETIVLTLSQQLPEYLNKHEIPKLIRVVPTLVYTQNGKPDTPGTLKMIRLTP